MRTILFLSILTAFVFTSCGGNDQGATEEVETSTTPSVYAAAATALEAGESPAAVSKLLMDNFQAVSDPNTGALNVQASQDFVTIATQLADKFPSDTLAAMPLYRAAEVVRAMNDPKLTASIYQKVYNNYPSFSKAPEALFMLGFTYDEDLGDLEKAKATYTDFLQKYPTHSFADDTQMLMENLGKSDEEILMELEKKAGQ
ncbi:tetratricopeptide repeat protein [Neolewinella persica]|uniref:tetratricopeptide repeat protein n=1 Tax=Neolewinella persica TaxID=70998 RepID=UPI00035FDEE4|nr:tetratricopeptide repeat protein [Neolewinella persica]